MNLENLIHYYISIRQVKYQVGSPTEEELNKLCAKLKDKILEGLNKEVIA